jgi:mono/diheme cytochrome c family protein
LSPRTALLLLVCLLWALLWIGCSRKNLTTPELYATYCARCHGERGEGKGDNLALYPHLNLLTSPMVRRGDRAAVRQRIRDGYGPMPGFARRLDRQEVERLVDLTFQLGNAKERP